MDCRVSIWHLLWRLICYAQRLYWADTILWLFIAGLPAVPGILIREFFNVLTEQSASDLSVWAWIALLLATGLARIVVIFTGRITKTQHRFTMSALVRHNLLAGLMRRPGSEPLAIAGADQPISPGAVISFFREDASQLEDNVVGTNEILGEGVFAVSSLILLFSVNATITLVVFFPLVMISAILHRIGDRIKRYRRASRQSTQQVTSMVGEIFASVQAIKVAGAEEPVLNHFRQLCDRRQHLMIRDQLLTAILESSFDNLVSIGTGIILLLAAQSMQSRVGMLSVGDFALFVYYLSYVTYFLSFLGAFLALTKQSEVSFERMQGLLNTGVDAIVAHHPLYLQPITGRRSELPKIQATQELNDAPLQDLVAQNLTYYYPGTNRGITDASLQLKRGSFNVITGQVGAGKTTLLRVLMGLLPMQSGEIYWNGHRVTNPAEFFVPPRSAYTPQVPQLFSNTLRENILLGLERTDEDLKQAIALSVFDQDVATMPDGLDTLIGSKGMRLSGGQLQRAAAARMLVRQPDLLVFDDLSSALDVETEQKLWTRLFSHQSSNPKSKTQNPKSPISPTYLVVSHRCTVLERSDRIIVLNHGRVEMEGTFDELPLGYIR
ncbi:MAG: ABC transporter ATP-binding protein [Elainellaceae cyanobacterium]